MSDGIDEVRMAEARKRAQEIAAKMAPMVALNGGEDINSRKRPLDEGEDGPQVKKLSMGAPGAVPGLPDPQAIAQAAIAKVGAQFGLTQVLTVEMKVPNRMVGLVIGRGGEMINRLQAESSAKIQVGPDGSEVNGERSVTICGTPDTVEKAKALVNNVIEEAGGATSVPVEESPSSCGSQPYAQLCSHPQNPTVNPGEEVAEIMIPSNKVGLIIGKGGEMIKTLQERAGCKMQMIQDGQYINSPDKPLRMTGHYENCKRAKELVTQLIEQKELEARGIMPTGPAGSHTIEVQVPKSLVGFVIGRNGEHINNIQNTCGVKLQFQNDFPGTEYRTATISGPPEFCEKARKMIEEIVGEMSMKGLVSGPSGNTFDRQVMGGGVGGGGGGAPGGMGGFRPRLELPNPTGPGVQTIQFPVPATKCGLIIGKGGDTIRQLQVKSGCHIELNRGPDVHPNPQEKLFNIRGTPQNIQIAQGLIREKCEMGEGGGFSQGMPYGGQMFNQATPYQGGQPGAGWTQYPYPQAYGSAAPPQQQQASDPSQAAWAAYYQQLYSAQAAQAGHQAAPGQQPPAQGGESANVQAQWAEYYRQLGYAYYGQGGQQQPGEAPAEQK